MAIRKRKDNRKRKPFDFRKKPIKPWTLMWLIKILCRIMLIGRKPKWTYVGNKPKGPCLILSNHASFSDFFMLFTSFKTFNMNYVMTIDASYDFTPFLVRLIGGITKRKFATDLVLMKNLKYTVDKLHDSVVIYPEARYSLDGTTSYIPEAIGKLAKFLNVPVYTLKLSGNHVCDPQWNKYKANLPLEAVITETVSQEELKTISASEIYNRILTNLTYDDWAWLKGKGNILTCETRAKNLNKILYQCPHCKAKHKMVGEGTTLTCTACGKKWEEGENGVLTAHDGVTEFSHIPDWFKWQRENVRKEVLAGTYYFEAEVDVMTLPDGIKYVPQGKGKLVQTPKGTTVTVNLYGEDKTFNYSGTQLESVHVEYDYKEEGDWLDFSIPDDSVWVSPDVKDCVTMLSLATEEIRDLAKKAIKS
ncbi:MAG: 1-acyl-sn-glycerol-3-phosphate acyltransferase [Clostridia bacterium]|nr:1-acyl-sn-glycerol-3-phosphate acyltransferase [Clostridia bacterium]